VTQSRRMVHPRSKRFHSVLRGLCEQLAMTEPRVYEPAEVRERMSRAQRSDPSLWWLMRGVTLERNGNHVAPALRIAAVAGVGRDGCTGQLNADLLASLYAEAANWSL